MDAVPRAWIEPIGWALIQFLWQGTVLALLYAAARALLATALPAPARYGLSCATLAAMVTAPVLTLAAGSARTGAFAETRWVLPPSALESMLPWLVLGWLAGASLFTLRLACGWAVTTRLRRTGVRAVPVEWQEAFDTLARRMGVTRSVSLLVSAGAQVPMVVGWLRPAVLMPVGALTGLHPDHVAALLAHELAHVRRADYLVNMLQRVAEALLFFHPGVWWISDQIRQEREMCCDDLAVQAHGDPLTYARALTDLEACRQARSVALAANGTPLITRIRRLLGHGDPAWHLRPEPGAVAAMTILWLIGVAAVAAQGEAPHGATASPARPASSPQAPAHAASSTLLAAMVFGPIGPAQTPAPTAPQTPSPSKPGPGTAAPGSPGAISQTPRDPQQVPQTGTGVIRGRVVRLDTGRPVRAARVTIAATGVRDLPTATTDNEGRYQLSGLPPARFTLTAAKGGLVTLQHGQRRPNEPGRPIDLGDGQTLEQLDIALPTGGVITGVVLDETGEPLGGAVVQAQRRRFVEGVPQPTPAPAAVDVTDDLGRFRLYGLPAQTFFVGAIATDPRMSDMLRVASATSRGGATYHPGTLSASQANLVSVGPGEHIVVPPFPVRRERQATITGAIRTADGKPAEITLTLSNETPNGTASRGVTVRPDGSFSIPNVTPGVYHLTGRERSATGTGTWTEQVAFAQVTIEGADVVVPLTLRRGSTLRGRVRFDGGSPPPGLEPAAIRLAMEGPGATIIDTLGGTRLSDDWTFEASGLLGRRQLRTRSVPPGWMLRAVRLDGRDITDVPLDFTGRDVSGVEVILTQRIPSITGVVTDIGGRPTTDATVVVLADDATRWVPNSRYVRVARPDQEGRFRAEAMPPGRYVAVAVDFLEAGEESSPDMLQRLRALGRSFTLGDGAQQALELRVTSVP
jgi:beta-lactamase regulating signal transducer with metallopeptidase domain